MQSPTRLLPSALLLAFCVFATPILAQEVADRMAPIYKALKLTPCELTAKGPFTPGDVIIVKCGIKNVSNNTLNIPLTAGVRSAPAYVLGGHQFWLERIGDDRDIPAVKPNTFRNGTRYAAGGAEIRSKAIAKSEVINFTIGGKVDTKDFPPGKYRISVEFRAKGNEQVVLQTESVDFELK